MRYFRYSLLFAFGIGLTLVGLTFIIYFQLHRGSDPTLIKVTFSLIGLGVPLAVQGIAGMFGYVKYSKVTGIFGFTLCILAILSFLYLYPERWIYPNISLVATAYALGLILVLGGLFAEVVQRIVESRMIEVKTAKTAEVNLEEIDRGFIEPVKIPESEITIKDVDVKVEFSKPVERIGKVVRVKDNVDYDANILSRVREGKLEVRVEDKEISEISKILKSMEERMKKD